MIASKRITKERVQLVLREPFFGRLVLRLEMVEDGSQPTGWVNGLKIGYNPDWIDKLSDEEIRGFLAHEVMHCSNLHPFRREWRNPDKWNVAADLSVNGILLDSGFKLPEGALRDRAFDGDAAERIYSLIPDPESKQGGRGQGKKGPKGVSATGESFDDIRDPGQDKSGAQSSGDLETIMEEWREATVQAATAARKAGKLPGGLDRFVRRVAAGRVDWRSLLRQFLDQVRASDYSWSRPSRRHISSGLILPSMRSIETGLIVFAFDTSGSMDERILKASWGECVSALEDIRPEAKLIMCDSRVQRVDSVEPGDLLPDDLNLPGGGGTDFRPIFKRIESEGWSPACVVIFTDLDGNFPDLEPAYPVIWIADNDRTRAPFGITLPVLAV
jgi:predicted metal-dependent peptidase